MTAAQNTAFQAGSGFTPATLLAGIASVVLVLAFIWVIWVVLGTFRAWQNGQAVARGSCLGYNRYGAKFRAPDMCQELSRL